jgi:transposase
MAKRRSFLDKFKVTVALEALRGDRNAQEIAAQAQSPPDAGDEMETAGD